MPSKKNKLYIVGSGGFASEVFSWAADCGFAVEAFVNEYHKQETYLNVPVIKSSQMNENIPAVIAIGNPQIRKSVAEKLLHKKFATIIHPSSIIGQRVIIQPGSIICPNAVITTNVVLGQHSQLHVSATIGHDCVVGEYFTASPMAVISGNSTLGDCVYFGTNSCLIEKKKIVSNVIIGASACVVKDIMSEGTYIGVPAAPIKKVSQL